MIVMLALFLRDRWRQMLVLAGLAAVLGALASAGAAYPGVIADRLAADEVSTAPVGERVVALNGTSTNNAAELGNEITELRRTDGMTTYFTSEIPVMGLVPQSPVSLVYRDGFCRHLTLASGRCPQAAGEVAIPADMGTAFGVFPGAQLVLALAFYDELQHRFLPSPLGGHPVTVVALYRPSDMDEDYWGGRSIFRISLRGEVSGPILTQPGTLALVPHDSESWSSDTIVGNDLLTGSGWEVVRQRLLEAGVTEPGERVPELMDRVAAKRDYVAVMAPAVLLPVLVLGLVVIFIVSSRRVQHERIELGVQGLRGLPAWQRWWLAVAPAGAMILIGTLTGGIAGILAIGRFSAGVALAVLGIAAGAIGSVALAATPVLRARTADALRRIVPSGLARLPVVEVLLGALAVASVLQLRTGDRSGLGVFAAALLAGALAVAIARALPLVARPLASWGIRRGRLVLGLAMARLGRAQGGRQLLALTALTVALVSLVASARDVAGTVRDEQVALSVGADRVLTVQAESVGAVISAVHTVDPDGKFAVAVGQLSGDTDRPGMLAIDLSRAGLLAWPDASTLAGQLMAAEGDGLPLLPSGPATITATLTEDPADAPKPGQPRLRMRVINALGRTGIAEFGALRVGDHEYTATIPPGCAGACRVVGLELQVGPDVTARLRLTKLEAGTAVIDDFPQWHELSRVQTEPEWRLGGAPSVAVAWLMPSDAPQRLPVATTPGLQIEARGMTVPGPEGTTPGTDLEEVASLRVLPRLGERGILADLGALSRATGGAAMLDQTEVWLTADAPADVVDRLNATGVRVSQVERRDDVRELADRTAPALTLRMHVIAAVTGLLLLLAALLFVAGVDRGSSDVAALRTAGVSMRTVRRSQRAGYLAITTVGTLLGLAAGAVAWLVARQALPLFDREPWSAPPTLPHVVPVLLPVAVAVAVLALAAWLAFLPRNSQGGTA